MKVISFFLCNRVAQTVPGNEYDIYGYWGEIQRVPALPLSTTLVAFLHVLFEDSETGDHLLTVKVIDPNKNILTSVDVPVTTQKANMEFVVPIVVGPLAIERPGNYRLLLEVDKIYRYERRVVLESHS